jgi:hypothetical protein
MHATYLERLILSFVHSAKQFLSTDAFGIAIHGKAAHLRAFRKRARTSGSKNWRRIGYEITVSCALFVLWAGPL